MATTNNLGSNTSTVVARVFNASFESSRVLSRAVNTTKIDGLITPATGSTAYVKRPHQYGVISTADGDISGATKSNIEAGRAAATVQNMLTVAVEYSSIQEATQLDQLEEILRPMAETLSIGMESALGTYMLKNAGITVGDPTKIADTWEEVALAGAQLTAIGAPAAGEKFYVMTPYLQTKLAGAQSGLNASDTLVRTAWENAQISGNFGGLRAIASNALKSFTATTAADRAGALAANPDVTYITAKDTMTQSLSVTGFSANAVVKAGDTLEVTGKYMVNPKNGEIIRNAAGTAMPWRTVVTADVTLDGAGAGVLVCSPAAIYVATGNYNTTNAALAQNDVITLITATAASLQPNMYFHKEAFGVATVRLPKLYATDVIWETKDGLYLRMTKYSDGDKGIQKVRFDLLPVFATFNPLWAGQAYGTA